MVSTTTAACASSRAFTSCRMVSGVMSGQSPDSTTSDPSKPASASLQDATASAVPPLLGLHHHLRVPLHQRNHLLAPVADHAGNAPHPRLAGGIDHPAHQRLAQHFMGDLGLLGLHAGPRTRG